jgi:hypothetical protein
VTSVGTAVLTHYRRKDRRDGKTRKKTSVAAGDFKEKRRHWNLEEGLY